MIVQKSSVSNIKNMEQYVFIEKDVLVGNGYININLNTNNIYVFVNPEFRSQGIGSYITRYMMEMLRSNNIKQTTLMLESNNRHACSMVEKLGAINVSKLDGITKYILPIIK